MDGWYVYICIHAWMWYHYMIASRPKGTWRPLEQMKVGHSTCSILHKSSVIVLLCVGYVWGMFGLGWKMSLRVKNTLQTGDTTIPYLVYHTHFQTTKSSQVNSHPYQTLSLRPVAYHIAPTRHATHNLHQQPKQQTNKQTIKRTRQPTCLLDCLFVWLFIFLFIYKFVVMSWWGVLMWCCIVWFDMICIGLGWFGLFFG